MCHFLRVTGKRKERGGYGEEYGIQAAAVAGV